MRGLCWAPRQLKLELTPSTVRRQRNHLHDWGLFFAHADGGGARVGMRWRVRRKGGGGKGQQRCRRHMQPEAWMSAVHLARKPAAARPATPEWTAAAAARAAHINNIAGCAQGGQPTRSSDCGRAGWLSRTPKRSQTRSPSKHPTTSTGRSARRSRHRQHGGYRAG